MKVAIFLLSLVAVGTGAPSGIIPLAYNAILHAPATILHQVPLVSSNQFHAQDLAGQYSYGYATSEGQGKIEHKTINGEVAGKFSYIDADGKLIRTRYTAGRDGFKAEGDHLPKQVEIPEVPEEVKEAMDKAMGEFEEAKNRKAPEPVEPVKETAEVRTVSVAQAAMPVAHYSASLIAPLSIPYASKSIHWHAA